MFRLRLTCPSSLIATNGRHLATCRHFFLRSTSFSFCIYLAMYSLANKQRCASFSSSFVCLPVLLFVFKVCTCLLFAQFWPPTPSFSLFTFLFPLLISPHLPISRMLHTRPVSPCIHTPAPNTRLALSFPASFSNCIHLTRFTFRVARCIVFIWPPVHDLPVNQSTYLGCFSFNFDRPDLLFLYSTPVGSILFAISPGPSRRALLSNLGPLRSNVSSSISLLQHRNQHSDLPCKAGFTSCFGIFTWNPWHCRSMRLKCRRFFYKAKAAIGTGHGYKFVTQSSFELFCFILVLFFFFFFLTGLFLFADACLPTKLWTIKSPKHN